MKDKVMIEGKETSILDILNPPGLFRDGARVHQWTTKNLLPMSGKLIPEFDRRRNIRDMFSKKPSLPNSQSSNGTFANGNIVNDSSPSVPIFSEAGEEQSQQDQPAVMAPSLPAAISPPKGSAATKRVQEETPLPAAKRAKPASQPSNAVEIGKGQKSLKGFFAPKTVPRTASQSDGVDEIDETKKILSSAENAEVSDSATAANGILNKTPSASPATSQLSNGDNFVDPIASKESWGKLFIKPSAPKCEHDEPCKTMLTKKSGVNCGRSFWMCARPLGPSGHKEKNTQWRCSTFIWASDWNGGG
jgi:AP endonuclease 2